MKKSLRISTPVMKRIVTIEKSNLVKIFLLFSGVFVTLGTAFTVVTLLFIRDVKDLGTLDVLSLFWEDHEIVSDYWREALSTVWLEVPREYMYMLIGIIFVTIMVVSITARKRKTLRTRAQKLASYEKSSTLGGGGKHT